jgi:hypothetical protein
MHFRAQRAATSSVVWVPTTAVVELADRLLEVNKQALSVQTIGTLGQLLTSRGGDNIAL